ncbi:MAG: glycosyltransferase family 39 protein [Actinomycetota bacterium]|nr:glycosyltransferase family 39 protein [Actinomycetota bacterium]
MATSSLAAVGGPRTLLSRLARTDVLVLGGIVALGAWLRFRHLGMQSYWFDESVTVRILDQPLGAMIDAIPRSESTPPLYYVLGWVWTRIFGVSEAGLRSLSAVAGVATLPLVWAAGRRLVHRTAGLVAAGLCAVNPTLVWYSQEARSYALMACLGALSFLLFVRAWQQPGGLRLAVWALACAAALTTHYFSAFLILPEAAALLWRWRRSQRGPVICAVAAIGAVGAALLPLARHQEASGRTAWIAASDLGDRIRAAGQELLSAGTHSITTGTQPRSLWSIPAAVLLVGALALLLRQGDQGERSGAGLAALVGAGTILVPLALVLTPIDFFQDRNLLAAWIPLSVAIGAAFAVRRAAPLGLLAAAALGAIGLWVDHRVVGEPGLQRADWRGLAHAIGPPSRARALLVSPGFNVAPLAVYGHPTTPVAPGARVQEIDVVGQLSAGTPPVGPGGFGLAQRVARRELTLLRYRGSGPLTLTQPALAQLGPLVLDSGTPAAR